jgi:flagellar biosynthesis protein FlhG
MSEAQAATAPRSRRQIWSVGGGKGGIGKTLLVASLGWQLARLGKRVILVDADLAGANLHTCLGLEAPRLTLADFILRRVERIEEVVVETGFPRLRLVSGASDFLGAANVEHAQKTRVLNRIQALDVDVVVMDLGAGGSPDTIDYFLASDPGLLVVVPEPTSIENSYRFIRAAAFRHLHAATPRDAVAELIEAAMDPSNSRGIRTPLDLLAAVEGEDPEAVVALRRELDSFRPRFVVNQVRDAADMVVGHQLVAACTRHLGVHATYAGHVPYDEAVWQSVRRRRLFMAAEGVSAAAEQVRQLVHGLLRGKSLTLKF